MTDTTPIIGPRIRLDRTIDTPCACGEPTVTIGPGTEPHVASLTCAACDRHRGWLPRAIAEFLLEVVRRFGRPADAVAIRNSTTEFAQANEAAHPVQARLPFPHHEPKRN
jgi:hypothetical protein